MGRFDWLKMVAFPSLTCSRSSVFDADSDDCQKWHLISVYPEMCYIIHPGSFIIFQTCFMPDRPMFSNYMC